MDYLLGAEMTQRKPVKPLHANGLQYDRFATRILYGTKRISCIMYVNSDKILFSTTFTIKKIY
jgi:hypothetical protein